MNIIIIIELKYLYLEKIYTYQNKLVNASWLQVLGAVKLSFLAIDTGSSTGVHVLCCEVLVGEEFRFQILRMC